MTAAAAVLLIGKLAFGAVGLATGFKVLAMARAEGGAGLHHLAAGCIFVGGLGLALNAGAHALGSGGLGRAVCIAGDLGVRGAMVGLAVFVWRVFRPGSGAARAGVGAIAALLVGTFAWDLISQPDLLRHDDALPSAHATQLAVAIPFVWSSVEAWLQWSAARRRAALGMASLEAVRRFRLWGLATGAFVGVCALASGVAVARQAGAPDAMAAAQVARGLLYLAIVACVVQGLFRVPREAGHRGEDAVPA